MCQYSWLNDLICFNPICIVKVLMGIHLLIFLVWIKSHDHTQYPLMLARACLNPDGPFEAMPFYGEGESTYLLLYNQTKSSNLLLNYQLCIMNASLVFWDQGNKNFQEIQNKIIYSHLYYINIYIAYIYMLHAKYIK